MAKPLTYEQAGVDIEAGDKLVDLIDPVMRRTHGPRVIGKHGMFAGMFRLDYNEHLFKRNYREPVLVACTDGVGTKVKLAAECGVYNSIGIDCVAMNVNDLIVQGAEPLLFLDYMGLNKVVPEQAAQIVEGIAKGCELADCALIGGETAEMPDIYATGDFDLAGFSLGVVELARLIDPMRVETGDVVIGLASSGVHSNGFSLVRRILSDKNLKLNQTYEDFDDQSLGTILLEPTRIYAKSVVRLLRRYKVKHIVGGMAHITGGGLPGNLCRALPNNLDAIVDRTSWQVPPIFEFLQHEGDIDQREMWRVFNMGVGYVMIVRPSFADSVVRQLNRSDETAWIMGEVVAGSGSVKLA